ncbi:hypothetical protein RFI_09336 [Reticulomyxa filosa]|uniref:CNNM transmembrane domain-containing protein n=1 Tax=Reticulomyxa filosa TaxID=46433 RepID=X6NR22_RETFI|nr:hypothetical protein RFI_09336 [Reticulomyxa filosa]|eukprot:ETO27797.1 hypothetical protein RFI_09336 [Reticulomyxa filosa]
MKGLKVNFVLVTEKILFQFFFFFEIETLPIFLDQLVAPWLAIIISVTFVLVFGEILPQALLASDPLKAGYYFAWLVKLLQTICFPLTYPLSLLLDVIVKHPHSVVFTHEEMVSLFGVISQDQEARHHFHKDELLLLSLVNFFVLFYFDQINKIRNKKKKFYTLRWRTKFAHDDC